MSEEEIKSEDAQSGDEQFGDGFDAVFAVIDGGQECSCEYVNIGVGYEKVAETPDCPRCTSFGMTMTILAALAGRLLPAGGQTKPFAPNARP